MIVYTTRLTIGSYTLRRHSLRGNTLVAYREDGSAVNIPEDVLEEALMGAIDAAGEERSSLYRADTSKE